MKRRRELVKALFTVLAVSVLAGCGGGGSSSSSAAPLATKTRLLQAGDTWVYDVTGSSVGSNPVTATGAITITISSKPFNGGTALARETTAHFVTSDTHTIDFVSTKYFTQDSTSREIREIGESSSDSSSIQTVANPQTIIFGSWANAETLNPTLDFGGGDVETGPSQTIADTETIQTPAGKFAAWKVTTPSPLIGDTNPVVADWAPQLGAPVKFGTFFGYSNDSGLVTIPATAVLKSTTVPH